MGVVHHCCQLGLGGKHITAPFCLCRHLGLFAITKYDMPALQSALKFYWLLRQVPRLQCVLQAGSPSGESRGPGFPHWGPAGRGRGLGRGRSPRALRSKQGKNYGEPACRCVCVCLWTSPAGGDRLPHASRGRARSSLHSALSAMPTPGHRSTAAPCPRRAQGPMRQAPPSLRLIVTVCLQTEGNLGPHVAESTRIHAAA